jgi:hypothetical protein
LVGSVYAQIYEVWVDDDWFGTTPGVEVETGKFFGVNAFAYIQDAIDSVEDGGTIYIANGTYNMSSSWDGKRYIHINKSLTLKGDGSGLTILDADHAYSVLDDLGGGLCGPHATVIWNEAQDLTIEGISVKGGDYGIRSTTVDLTSIDSLNSLNLTDVVVTDNYGLGVVFENNITAVFIKNCEASYSGDMGVYFTPNCDAETVTVTDVNASNNGHIGFSCQGSVANLSIEGGTFNDNTGGNFTSDCNDILGPYYGFGIEVRNSVGTIENITATGNGFNGPNITADWGLEGGAGIIVKGGNSDITIAGASLQNNMNGLWIEDPDSVENWGAGCVGPVEIYNSNIENNQEFGAMNPTSCSVDAERNWWDSSDGPGGNAPGSGDSVSSNVDFDRWLCEEYPTSKIAYDNDGDDYRCDDCDDNDNQTYPEATEICDSKDNDCDGDIDEGLGADNCQSTCEIYRGFFWVGNGGQLNCCGDDLGEDDPYEVNEVTCNDTHDNDCDGLIDCVDPDCTDEIGPGGNFCCLVDNDCNDGLYCNGMETCVANECQSGTPPDCSDLYGCTIDFCNETSDSCENIANDTSCSDGVACNGQEYCDINSGCQPGTNIDCSYLDDQCNIGICTEPNGTCVQQPVNESLSCDDGLFCTMNDVCTSGVCSGNPRPCDDGIECTDNICNETSDQCENPNLPNGTLCGQWRNCSDIGCYGDFVRVYPDDGHDTCDGLGNCIQYSCNMLFNYCSDSDPLDGINGWQCGAECDQDSDCNDYNETTLDECLGDCTCNNIPVECIGDEDCFGDGWYNTCNFQWVEQQ